MDANLVRQHLDQALAHIAEGDRHIAEQQQLIVRLDLHGLETTHARKLLASFEDMQRLHKVSRDRALRQLAELNQRGSDG